MYSNNSHEKNLANVDFAKRVYKNFFHYATRYRSTTLPKGRTIVETACTPLAFHHTYIRSTNLLGHLK